MRRLNPPSAFAASRRGHPPLCTKTLRALISPSLAPPQPRLRPPSHPSRRSPLLEFASPTGTESETAVEIAILKIWRSGSRRRDQHALRTNADHPRDHILPRNRAGRFYVSQTGRGSIVTGWCDFAQVTASARCRCSNIAEISYIYELVLSPRVTGADSWRRVPFVSW